MTRYVADATKIHEIHHFNLCRKAMIGIQMAFAYVGFLIMPPLFGIVAEKISISLLPWYQMILVALLILMHELVIGKCNNQNKEVYI